jgi:lysophospholipase L1-like esterase
MNTINREPLNKDVVVLNDNILTTEEYPSNPCDYDGFEISLFNKIICVGDSLTEGVCNYTEGGQSIGNVAFPNYAYPKFLAKLTGCTVDNKGRAGYTIKQWYDYYQNTDLSGYDMAIIQLGVNDALQNGWTQEAETSMTAIINKLKSDNNKIKVFVATLIPAFAYSGTRFNAVSEAIRTYVNGLNDTDVMLLDMAVYAHTKELKAYNNGHLTGYGYLRLAKDYKAYISRVINLNPEKFREVQFIGTDHVIS